MANQSPDSYNRGGFYAFIFSMVFSLGFFAYIVAGPGIDLQEIPAVDPSLEGKPAAPAIDLTNFDVNKVEKPWTASPELIAYGKKVYTTNCAVCHGDKGLGDGPAGAALNPKPRNLIEGAWKAGGDEIAHYNTLTNGLPGTSMAAFKHLPKNDRWALVHFIHSITKNKTETEPAALEKFAQSAQ